MNTLLAKNAGYSSLEIEIIDELDYPGIAEKHDYFYVPTYYIDGRKVHEGAVSINKIRRVLNAALK